MALLSTQVIQRAATDAAAALGHSALPPQQLEALTAVASGRDVFASLPTGFGKSLCFFALPRMFVTLRGLNWASIVLVVSPLIALMTDQARS